MVKRLISPKMVRIGTGALSQFVCLFALFGIACALPYSPEIHELSNERYRHLRSGVGIFKSPRSQNVSPSSRPRVPRGIQTLTLKDPLDCLSQVVCGLNTFPPQKPSARTSAANDFAYLLKTAIKKLRAKTASTTTTTSTTTAAPTTQRSTTTKAPLQDDDDEEEEDENDDEYYNDDYTRENDVDYQEDDFGDYSDRPSRNRRRGRHFSTLNERESRSKKSKKAKGNKLRSKKRNKNAKGNKRTSAGTVLNIFITTPAPTLTPLDRLRIEKDLRTKLISDAQCFNGLIDHACPFNYPQMLNLISTSLERERTVSFSSDKVLPMVGYLIKSRNYTGTLEATFQAIEKINNYTIEADEQGKPVDFSHILDEVINRVSNEPGLRIVDTSNEEAWRNPWEDDEFDHVLENPYVRRRPSPDIYKLNKKKKEDESKKKLVKEKEKIEAEADESKTSEEDTSEEGLVFDSPKPAPSSSNGQLEGESSSEEEELEEEEEKKKTKIKVLTEEERKKERRKKLSALAIKDSKKKLSPPPVFGHLQRKAEDE